MRRAPTKSSCATQPISGKICVSRLYWLAALLGASGCHTTCHTEPQRLASNALVESKAVPSATHPLAGFWKERCSDEWGLAIGPISPKMYFVSFCGPGGCFAEGTYRPNSQLYDDLHYHIIDTDHIDVLGGNGFTRYVRCPARKPDG